MCIRDSFGGAQNIYRVIADAFKIADGVEQSVHTLAVGMAHFTAGQLDEIGCLLYTSQLCALHGTGVWDGEYPARHRAFAGGQAGQHLPV